MIFYTESEGGDFKWFLHRRIPEWELYNGLDLGRKITRLRDGLEVFSVLFPSGKHWDSYLGRFCAQDQERYKALKELFDRSALPGQPNWKPDGDPPPARVLELSAPDKFGAHNITAITQQVYHLEPEDPSPLSSVLTENEAADRATLYRLDWTKDRLTWADYIEKAMKRMASKEEKKE